MSEQGTLLGRTTEGGEPKQQQQGGEEPAHQGQGHQGQVHCGCTGGYGSAASPHGSAASPHGSAASPHGSAASPHGSAASPRGSAADRHGCQAPFHHNPHADTEADVDGEMADGDGQRPEVKDLGWLIQSKRGKAPKRRVGDWDGRPRDSSEDRRSRQGDKAIDRRGRQHSRPRSRDRASQRVDRRREEAPPRGGGHRHGGAGGQYGSAGRGSGTAAARHCDGGRQYGRKNPGTSSSGQEKEKPRGCYHCGQEGHYARDCRNERACRTCRKPGHEAKNCPEGANSRKRGREDNSGLTPPGKRNPEASAPHTAATASSTATSAPGTAAAAAGTGKTEEATAPRAKAARYSYARAVQETNRWTIALSGMDGTSPDDTAISGIKEYLNGLLVKETLEHGTPPAKIVGWKPSPRALLVEAETQGSFKWLWDILSKQSVRVETYAAHKARIETSRSLSGFIRSPTSEMRLEDLKVLVAGDLRSQKVGGVVTVCKVDPTPKGGLLRLKVDQEAYEDLVNLGLEIHVGAHGRVQLNEHGVDRSKELEEEDLQNRMERLRQTMLEAQQKLEAAEAEAMMRANAAAVAAVELSAPKDSQLVGDNDGGRRSPSPAASHATSYADSEGDDARMEVGAGGGGGGTGGGTGGSDAAGIGAEDVGSGGDGGDDQAGVGAGGSGAGGSSSGGGAKAGGLPPQS